MPRKHRKTDRSSNLLAQQRRARLEVRGRIWEAVILDLSPSGFGVWVEGDPEVEANELIHIRTITECYTVRVASVVDYRDGYRLGLRLLEEKSPRSSDLSKNASVKTTKSSPDPSAASSPSAPSEKPSRWVSTAGPLGWLASDEKGENAPFPLSAVVAVAVLVAISPLVWSQWDGASRPSQKAASPRQVEPAAAVRTAPSHAVATEASEAETPFGSVDFPVEASVAEVDPQLLDGKTLGELVSSPVEDKSPTVPVEPDEEPNSEPLVTVSAPSNESREPVPNLIQIRSELTSWSEAATTTLAEIEPRVRESARERLAESSRPTPEAPTNQPVLIAPQPKIQVEPAIADNRSAVDESEPETTVRAVETQRGTKAFSTGLRLLATRNPAAASHAFEKASHNLTDDPKPRYFLAITQYLTGDRARAEQTLAAAVRLESTQPAPELGHLMQRIQGPSRRWMEQARRRARVGPYRPRFSSEVVR